MPSLREFANKRHDLKSLIVGVESPDEYRRASHLLEKWETLAERLGEVRDLEHRRRMLLLGNDRADVEYLYIAYDAFDLVQSMTRIETEIRAIVATDAVLMMPEWAEL